MKEIKRKFTKILQQRLAGELNFIQVVLGPRQVGKTTGLQQIVREWQGPSLMITADEVVAPSKDWLVMHWERARDLGKEALLVIDEVQKIPDWSSVIKFLYDQDRRTKRCKIVLLGSASLTLQKGFAESLAGRYEIIPAYHWDLQECNESFGWTVREYLKFGSYPAASELTDDISRWQSFIRNSIIEPVLIKDILGLSAVNKPALFRQTFELAMAYPAQEISLQKMLGQLQESGNVTTVKHYLDLFEGAYLLKTLQKYTGSEVKKRGSSPKIIPLNNALVHAFRNPDDMDTDREWYGRTFEAAIGASLSRSSGKLYYWREGRFEVDFVLELERKIYAIEVKSARKRSTAGLETFTKRYSGSIPVILDHDKGSLLFEMQEVDGFFSDRKFT